MNSLPGEININLKKIESFVNEACEKKVDIICFPELSITGYILKNPGNIYSASESKAIIKKIQAIARSKNLTILAGMIEISDRERPYITQIVAGPNGLLGLYRKTHLSPTERDIYKAGQSIEVFRTGNLIFGVQLCYESHFPEISTIMALKGAKIIFIPHASPRGSPEEKLRSWQRHLPSRAFDNAVFLVACNQVGQTRKGFSFPGVAIACGPMGRIITSYGKNKEKMILTEIKMNELFETRRHKMRYFLPNRRPELYQDIFQDKILN